MEYLSFIRYLEIEKNYSPLTIEAYGSDLKAFFEFITKIELYELEQIDAHAIRAWQVDLMEKGISARSVARKMSSVNSWFKYLRKQGLTTENPFLKIILPKQSKTLPVYIKESQIFRFFEEVKFADNFEGQRDKLIFHLLYETGIRRAELLSLKEKDIDFGRNVIRILGKGNKERLVPMGDFLKSSLNDYLSKKEGMNLSCDSLLVTEKGKKLSTIVLTNIVKEYLNIIPELNKKSPHVMRHTFATHLMNSGADISTIKELLGHSSLAATQVYTHISIEKLKNTYKKAHPRANKKKGGNL